MKNKGSIIIIIILIIFGIITIGYFTLFQNFNSNNNISNYNNNSMVNNNNITNTVLNKKSYIVIGDNGYIVQKTHFMSASDSIIENKYFNVYIDGTYYGKYNLKKGNKWLLFNGDEYKSYDGMLFAFQDDLNIEVKKIGLSSITDENINEIKKIYGRSINVMNELYYSSMRCINSNECFIDSTNLYDIDDINYNLVYYKNNNKLYEIIKQTIKSSEAYNYPHYRASSVFELNNELYVAISGNYYGESGKSLTIYKFDGNKFIKVI